MASIYYIFDFGDCAMGAMVESPRFHLGTVVEFQCGLVGQIVFQCVECGMTIYRIQNDKYLNDLIAAETAIETLRRNGWVKIASFREGRLRSVLQGG